MTKRIPSVLIAALAASVLIAGCGGGGNSSASSSGANTSASSTATEGSLTRSEFIKRGDAICEKAHKRIFNRARAYRVAHANELNRLKPIPREERVIRVLVLPTVIKEAEGLESLGAPKGDEEQIKSLVAGIEAAVGKAKTNPYSISGEAGYGKNPFHDIDNRLREYGFEVCRIIS